MLDIGWGELLVIGVVSLIVVGPKDLPRMFKIAGQYMGRARGMAREFQRSMEQAADDSGLKDASDGLRSINRLNLNSSTNSARKYAESLVKGIDEAASDGPGAKTPGVVSPIPPAPKPAAPRPVAPPSAEAPAPPGDTAQTAPPTPRDPAEP